MLLGVGISLSRGAWLSLAAGVLVVAVVRAPVLLRRAAPVVAFVALLVPLGVALAGPLGAGRTMDGLLSRLSTLDVTRLNTDISVRERLDQYAKALEGIGVHPILGNGTGSFGQSYTYLTVDQPGWVGNLELHLLYDSGLLGFAGFWLALGAAGLGAVRAYRRARDPLLRAAILGLGAGLLTLLVAYQTTEATWLAFTWVHLGLLVACSTLAVRPVAATPA